VCRSARRVPILSESICATTALCSPQSLAPTLLRYTLHARCMLCMLPAARYAEHPTLHAASRTLHAARISLGCMLVRCTHASGASVRLLSQVDSGTSAAAALSIAERMAKDMPSHALKCKLRARPERPNAQEQLV
jgi:hypothetical protein